MLLNSHVLGFGVNVLAHSSSPLVMDTWVISFLNITNSKICFLKPFFMF